VYSRNVDRITSVAIVPSRVTLNPFCRSSMIRPLRPPLPPRSVISFHSENSAHQSKTHRRWCSTYALHATCWVHFQRVGCMPWSCACQRDIYGIDELSSAERDELVCELRKEGPPEHLEVHACVWRIQLRARARARFRRFVSGCMRVRELAWVRVSDLSKTALRRRSIRTMRRSSSGWSQTAERHTRPL
jgi:hypothetical protein